MNSKALASDCPGAREQTAVDGVYNRWRVDHSAAKVSTVETLDGVFAALDFVKLEVNVSFRVRIDRDVDNMPISLFRFLSNLIFELFDPVVALLTVGSQLASLFVDVHARGNAYSVGSNILCNTTQRLAIFTLTGRGFVSVLGLRICWRSSLPLVGASSVLASFLINASRL